MTAARSIFALVLAVLVTGSVAADQGRADRPLVPEELVQEALAGARVRVIVHLATGFVPEGHLPTAHVAAQRQNIAVAQATVLAGLRGVAHSVHRQYDALPFLALEVGLDGLHMLESLRDLVTAVEEDRILHPALAESVPLIRADVSWARGADGSGTVIAILDTGVRKSHPFLSGKVVAEACFSSNVQGLATSLCPGGATTATGAGSGINCPATIEGCAHGTHVAGIAAGNGAGAGVEFSGVAKGAQLMSIQVFSKFNSQVCGGSPCIASFVSDVLAALNHVFSRRLGKPGELNLASVNMSLGGDSFTANCDTDPTKAAIDQLRSVGIATVVASGNDGFTDAISTPACISSAISVGSVGDGSLGAAEDQVSSFSSSASFLSLLAPGQWINSSVLGDRFENHAGTSMAAPHVAGAFAILKQVDPSASVTDLLAALQSTGLPVTDARAVCPTCVTGGFTRPRIDVDAAVAVFAQPDLVVSALTGTPAKASPGATVDVLTAVRNQGYADAGPSEVAIFLSPDSVIDPATDTLLATRSVPALAPGATSSETTAVTIPLDAPAGTAFIGVVADAGGEVPESDETNNTRASSPFQVAKPDLIVAGITVPTTVATGQMLAVTNTVKNQSTLIGASSFAVGIFLSTDTIIDPASDSLLGTRTVSSLAANTSDTKVTKVTIPAGQEPGTYFIGVVADLDAVVLETNESNNRRASSAVTVVRPDVAVTAATAPSGGAPGLAVAVSNSIKNKTPAPVGAFDVGFYLSTDTTLDVGDTLLATRTINNLAAGGLSTKVTNATIPPGTAPGIYHVLVVADDGDALLEADEANNVRATGPITIARPDLLMTKLAAPTGVAGRSLAITNTMRNQAAAPAAAGPFQVDFYLSADKALDGGDVKLLGSRKLTGLGPSTSAQAVTTVVVPKEVEPGDYFLIAVADGAEEVAETDETNNTLATAAPIRIVRSDLTMTQLSAPTGVAGRSLAITNTVRNQAAPPAAAGPFQVDFYLSADNVLDGGDVKLLGSRTLTGLGPSTSAQAVTTVVVRKEVEPGDYFLIAVADGAEEVAETDETNNTLATPLPIRIVRSDLVMTQLSAPTGAAGRPLAITNTVRNQAAEPAAAGSFQVDFYLSVDDVLDEGDVKLLGSRKLTGLGPSTSAPAVTTVKVPKDMEQGDYFVIAVADGAEEVAETDETNNTLATASPIRILWPDLVVSSVTASPAGVKPGAKVTVTQTVRNRGQAPATAPASTSRIYLSSDSMLDDGDAPLKTQSIGPLAAGAEVTVTTTVTIPAETAPGSYFILVRADDANAIAETDEDNNTGATPTPIAVFDMTGEYLVLETAQSSSCPGVFPGDELSIPIVVTHDGQNLTFTDLAGEKLTGTLTGTSFTVSAVLSASSGGCALTDTITWKGTVDPPTSNFAGSAKDAVVVSACTSFSCSVKSSLVGTRPVSALSSELLGSGRANVLQDMSRRLQVGQRQ